MIALLKKYQFILGLLALFLVTMNFGSYYTILVIFTLIVLQFFYSVFYTTLPRIRDFYVNAGLVIGAFNLTYPLTTAINIFVVIAALECIRIVVMAILRYPATIHDLKSLTRDLERRVEERTIELLEANRQLKVANERLQVLDALKSAFVSQASHDLRTPLTAIKGSLDNLSLGVAGVLTEKQKKILDRVTRSVDRLTNLINDIFDLSRIESGRTVLEINKFSMKELVHRSIQENLPAAEQKRIALRLEKNDDPCMIHADRGKIARVVGKLISNAIKYTPEKGTVLVRLCQEGNAPAEPRELQGDIPYDLQYDPKGFKGEAKSYIALAIHDTGIGMVEEDLKRIWERFYRTNASKHFAKGSGLGLSIAKELVEMHGESITVESEVGKGTTFTLCLPTKKMNQWRYPDENSLFSLRIRTCGQDGGTFALGRIARSRFDVRRPQTGLFGVQAFTHCCGDRHLQSRSGSLWCVGASTGRERYPRRYRTFVP